MGSAAWRVRAGILVLLGALVVHELRYVLAGQHPDAHAHAYMGRLVPFVSALLLLAGIEFIARFMRRRRVRADALAAGGVRWLALGTILFAIFAAQETAEVLFEHGRLDVADSLIVHGGWLGAPLSFAVAAVVTLLLRGASALLTRTGRVRLVRPRAPQRYRLLPRRSRADVPVIARNLAGRAPPSFVN
jgi:hypothetical protein